MISIGYCKKRQEMFKNKSSQRVHCRGQCECERELAAGEMGVFCGPTLGKVHAAAGDFGLVDSPTEDCLDDWL